MTEYRAITAGALLPEESDIIIPVLLVDPDRVEELLIDSAKLLKHKSQKTRYRKVFEVQRRFDMLPKEIWQYYTECIDWGERAAILFLACFRHYRLLQEFHLKVVIDRWLTMAHTLPKVHIERFIEDKAHTEPELQSWSDQTKYKVGQVIYKMYKEAGFILSQNQLTSLKLSNEFWQVLIEQKMGWAMEVFLLNPHERAALKKGGQ